MKLKTLKHLSIVALLASNSAMASTVEQSFNYSLDLQSAAYTWGFTLPSFNTSLGVLNSVELILDTTAQAVVDIFNSDKTHAHSFTNASATFNISMIAPDATLITQVISSGVISGNAIVSTAIQSFTGLPAIHTVSDVFATDLTPFKTSGATNVQLNYTVDASDGDYTGTGSSKLLFGGEANIQGFAKVIYNYTASSSFNNIQAVPEPEQWAMILLGLPLVSWVARRRQMNYAAV